MSNTVQSETKRCPFCAETIQAQAIVCRYCGRDLRARPETRRAAPPKKKGTSPWLILALMFAGTCVGCMVLGLVIMSLGRTPKGVSSRTEKPSVTAPTATLAPLAPPFDEIRDTIQGMTEVQWKRYLEDLKGQRVEDWSGWVEDVDQGLSGQYELRVDMDSPDDSLSSSDIYIPIPEDLALSLQKDQQVMFSGTIERASEFLGSVSIHLERATVSGQ